MATLTVKRIVCLANSRKMAGRCVAGKEISEDGHPGNWIRPVSNREIESISERERCYADGNDPELLDIIEVPLLSAKPKDYQQENWLLDPSRQWRKVGRLSWDDLPSLADPETPLWTNGFTSRGGKNDQVPVDVAAGHDTSLRLIRVEDLTVIVSEPSRPSANFSILRGRFTHCNETYCFRITDPVSENGSINLPYAEYPVGERYLTVSLGEPFEGHAYKLIAAIIRP
ncbi:MAG: hypothetical protein OXL37_11470 [Chloroflexota bacterium]|nr:hypothetical protein [Chloroflexota bacterium]MDE2960505.1 hypothetical protein [Chloroflexota bacterium]